MTTTPTLISLRDAAERLSVPVKTLYGWISAEKIPALKIHSQWFFTDQQFNAAKTFHAGLSHDELYQRKKTLALHMRDARVSARDNGTPVTERHPHADDPMPSAALDTIAAAVQALAGNHDGIMRALDRIADILLELTTRPTGPALEARSGWKVSDKH